MNEKNDHSHILRQLASERDWTMHDECRLVGERIARGRDSTGKGRPAMVAPRDNEGQGEGDAATARAEDRAEPRALRTRRVRVHVRVGDG